MVITLIFFNDLRTTMNWVVMENQYLLKKVNVICRSGSLVPRKRINSELLISWAPVITPTFRAKQVKLTL